MERIKKIICLDDSKSHRSGLLPYAVEVNGINNARIYNRDGNYGQYVCDLNISGTTLKYLDIISRYDFIQEQIKSGIRTHSTTTKNTLISHINCSAGTMTSSVTTYDVWRPIVDYTNIPCSGVSNYYNYEPVDVRRFTTDLNGDYVKNDVSGVSDYAVLLSNYDLVDAYENEWKELWEDGIAKEDVFPLYDDDFDNFVFCQDVEKYILGIVRVPEYIIGSKVPNIVTYTNYNNYLNILNRLAETRSKDSKSAQLWESYGGDDFWKFLKKIKPIWVEYDKERNKNFFITPYAELPILLINRIEGEPYYSPYEYSYNETNNEFDIDVKPYSAEGIYSSLTPHFDSEMSGIVESALYKLYSPKAINISDDIYGIWETFGTKEIRGQEVEVGQMIKCRFNGDEWVFTNIDDAHGMKCADGEDVEPHNLDVYRNVTVGAAIEGLVPAPTAGDEYAVYARYKNDKDHPIDIPLDKEPHNIFTLDDGTVVYDRVYDMNTDETGSIELKYVIGATSGVEETTGIHYIEKLPYSACTSGETYLDSGMKAKIWYNRIDFNGNSTYVFNNDYNKGRMAKMARLNGVEICTEWTEDAAIITKLITKNGSEDFKDEPKYDINLSYDRGNAAAWEKHFKLGECNTLEDLENYGNNYFKI